MSGGDAVKDAADGSQDAPDGPTVVYGTASAHLAAMLADSGGEG